MILIAIKHSFNIQIGILASFMLVRRRELTPPNWKGKNMEKRGEKDER